MKKRATSQNRRRARKAKAPKVGDRVAIRFARGSTPARIVEDIGPFGVDGRRLFRVQLLEIDREFTVPVDDIVAPGADAP